MIMKMKKATLAKTYKFNTNRSVGMANAYRFSTSAITGELRSALRDFADIERPAELVKTDDLAIQALVGALNQNSRSIEAMTRAYLAALGKIADLETSVAKLTAEGAAYGLAGKRTKPADSKKTVYFSKDGDLYREPKAKHCYSMGTEKQRQKIVRVLLERKGYVPTDELVGLTGSKNRKSLHNAKLMINRKVRYALGIDSFIVGRAVNGYKLNPEYKIKEV